MVSQQNLIDIVGVSKEHLVHLSTSLGEKQFRAKQIWSWLYRYGALSFDSMTDLSKESRELFKNHFTIGRPKIKTMQQSQDGTIKWLLEFADGNEAETVFIPDGDRKTICVSSQVGCVLTCTFCHTGTQKLVRNLTQDEIVKQIMIVYDHFDVWSEVSDDQKAFNIVYMGMGEPLYNYDNIVVATKILMDSEGLAISRRKITLSTSGVVPKILECAKDLKVNLALSLHAVSDELRDQIVPLNKKYPLSEVIKVCAVYQKISNSRRVTFEYVMLRGINDSFEDAKKLIKLLHGIPCIVNLIPFNPWKGTIYECSDDDHINKFSSILTKAGIYAPIRRSRGQDIYAACGQLKSCSVRKKRVG
jgi:23S rRNA (adenine2503-C2)-methyltransferase